MIKPAGNLSLPWQMNLVAKKEKQLIRKNSYLASVLTSSTDYAIIKTWSAKLNAPSMLIFYFYQGGEKDGRKHGKKHCHPKQFRQTFMHQMEQKPSF